MGVTVLRFASRYWAEKAASPCAAYVRAEPSVASGPPRASRLQRVCMRARPAFQAYEAGFRDVTNPNPASLRAFRRYRTTGKMSRERCCPEWWIVFFAFRHVVSS
jgi:hypothetical protein